jgi:hypothetical protein
MEPLNNIKMKIYRIAHIFLSDLEGWGFQSEHIRQALGKYILTQFSKEFDPNQKLLFGLTLQDLYEPLLDRVLSIPVKLETTDDPKENPSGECDMAKNVILISGVNYKRLSEDKSRAGYTAYLQSVIFHEYVHALNYIKKLWEEITYDALVLGKNYYSDPEEIRAYRGQMNNFLKETLRLSDYQVKRLMNKYTSDIDRNRKEYLDNIQTGKWSKRDTGYKIASSSDSGKYHYLINCVRANGRSIEEMIAVGKQVSWKEFSSNVSLKDLRYIFGGIYNFNGNKNNGLRIQDDYSVSFWKSKFEGQDCYYIDQSRIEYVFVRNS